MDTKVWHIFILYQYKIANQLYYFEHIMHIHFNNMRYFTLYK